MVRHAGASLATVTVRQANGELELVVQDDGQGFDVRDSMDKAAAGKALGLLGMQERVRMLGGEVEIASTPGEGTMVRAHMPIEVRV